MNLRYRLRMLPVLIGITVVLAACFGSPGTQGPNKSVPDDAPSPEDTRQFPGEESASEPEPAEPAPEPPEPKVLQARLVAVGDIMMHSPQIPAAYDVTTDTYSFHSYFDQVKPLLEGDWVFANLETPLAGEELGGYSGYPLFNAPEELADALREAGFNVLSTANNHSLDRWERGLLNTLANLKARGLIPVGTSESAEAAETITLVEKNGISMAFLAYTYGTNGIPIPEGKDYLVNLIDEAKIKADIVRAREQADVVTVSLHFGVEYQRQPNEEQKSLARSLVASGADIILGSHPHVVQPFEIIETVSDDGTPRQGIVIYSLGNFISNQGPDQGTAKYTDVGVIFSVNVTKRLPEGTVELKVEEPVPTWVHKSYANGKRQYRILPIEAALAAKNDPSLNDSHYAMLTAYLEEMDEHLHSMAVPAAIEKDTQP